MKPLPEKCVTQIPAAAAQASLPNPTAVAKSKKRKKPADKPTSDTEGSAPAVQDPSSISTEIATEPPEPKRARLTSDVQLIEQESGQSGKGRKNDSVIEKFSVKYLEIPSNKKKWGCIGRKQYKDRPCTHIASGNADKARLLDHVKNCDRVLDTVRKAALDELANEALKSEVMREKGKDEIDSVTVTTSDAATIVSEDGKSGPKLKAQSTLDLTFTEAGRKKVQDEVNMMIMKLICVDGLVPRILDGENWHDFVTALASGRYKSYKPTSASTFERKIIPQEAALVHKRTLKVLQKEKNLTITIDGLSTRSAHSAYTTHATTQDRNVYLLGAHAGSDEHHTAEYVDGVINKVSFRHIQ